MSKYLLILLGILSIFGFSVYYYNELADVKFIEIKYNNTANLLIYLCLSYCFFYIGKNEIKTIKYIFYTLAEFWLFLTMAYIFNDLFDSIIYLNKIVLTIILTFLCSLLLFYLWWRK